MPDSANIDKNLNLIFHALEHIHIDQKKILAALYVSEDDAGLLNSVLKKIERVAQRIQRLDAATP